MTTQQAVSDPVRRMYEAFNRYDIDAMMNCFDEDAEFVDVAWGQTLHGTQQLRTYFQKWFTAFPDGHGDIVNQVSSENQIVIEVTGRGTHQGVLPTPEGEIPPTGRVVEIQFCQIFRLQGGKIKNAKSYYDLLKTVRTLMQPLKAAA